MNTDQRNELKEGTEVKKLATAKEQEVKPLGLTWGENPRREAGTTHIEWHAPCGCAFHPTPFPHVHPCSDEHKRPDLNVSTKTLSDRNKALLLLYVEQVGMPPWARHPEGQAEVLSKLADWPIDRSKVAFESCANAGMANTSTDPLDAAIVTED